MKNSITPGDLGFKTIPRKGKIGTLICWDQWYPEAARLTALSGSEFFLSNSNRMAPERKSNMVKTNTVLG
jgi:predicted amidohydrolase